MNTVDSTYDMILSDGVIPYKSFEEMELSDDLAMGIISHGFEKPSKIQQVAIVPMKNGVDILAQSQSGTGKTGAFVIGGLTRVDPTCMKPQVLVINPTHELAKQTHKVATEIGQHLKIKTLFVTGGSGPKRKNMGGGAGGAGGASGGSEHSRSVQEDIYELNKGVQFISGTPGRIYDLLHRKAISTNMLKYIIIDEADQMLENRFKEQLELIFKYIPQSCPVALFSATMGPDMIELAKEILRNPVEITMKESDVQLKGITQYYLELDSPDEKFGIISLLYSKIAISQSMIFVNRKETAEWLVNNMRLKGHITECIHGELPEKERHYRMEQFRAGKIRVLISTDLLGRGIDVQSVSIVINYDMPNSIHNYTHRIGRCGRFGRKGMAINLIASESDDYIKSEIEKIHNIQIKELPEDYID